jgi:hypothetical protein
MKKHPLRRLAAGRYLYRGQVIVRRDPLTRKTNPRSGGRECVTWRSDQTYEILAYTLREAVQVVDRRLGA